MGHAACYIGNNFDKEGSAQKCKKCGAKFPLGDKNVMAGKCAACDAKKPDKELFKAVKDKVTKK